jgi:predicted O-methyltransferase YrrM
MQPTQMLTVGVTALKNFILGGNLVSLRWLAQPIKLMSYNAETLFLYKAMAHERGLKQRNVFEVLETHQEVSIVLGGLGPQTNWFSAIPSYTQDIASLCLLCQILKPKVVFEIGTAAGYTSLHFALNTCAESKIYTLDLPPGHSAPPALKTTVMDELQVTMYGKVADYLFKGSAVADKITCLFGDSATFDYRPYAGTVDLFFIDGAHSYEYVRSDTLKALECCHAGSVIAWHDFGRVGLNGVSRWLEEFARTHEVYATPGGSLAFMVVS